MPELPEVESIRLSLLPAVIGQIVGDVEIYTPGVFYAAGMPVTGWLVEGILRRGKYLVFQLVRPDGQKARLVVHLRMTGQLLLRNDAPPPEKHTHVRLRLDPQSGAAGAPLWLDYHDTRRFGRLWLLPPESSAIRRETAEPAGATTAAPSADLAAYPAGLDRLGPEPLDPDFGAPLLASQLRTHPRTRLKAALLDQTIVAGLGNIYADETAYAAGLDPARRVGSLTAPEIAALAEAIRQVITRAIACQGTSIRDYVNGWNQKGSFQDCLMVYGRSGEPCRRCGSPIRRIRLQGRSTCWCPECQPETQGDANTGGTGENP